MNTLTRWMIAFALLMTLAGAAHAEGVAVGGTCVPDSDTIARGLYHTAGFGVQFATGRVGRIRLLCPFTGDGGGEAKIHMSYIDPDGMGEGARVRASLRFARRGTNIGLTAGTCDSNGPDGSSATGPHEAVCTFTVPKVTFDFGWWEIIIERSDPTLNVEFLGVTALYQLSEGGLWPWQR